MIACVVFVVLMLFWLFWGYNTYDPAQPKGLGNTIIPWLCVAILGYMMFRDVSMEPRRVVVEERR